VEVIHRRTEKNQPALNFLQQVEGVMETNGTREHGFRIPARTLLDLVYLPDQRQATEPKVVLQETPATERRTSEAVLKRIAREFTSVRQIQEAVRSTTKSGPNAFDCRVYCSPNAD